MQNKAREPVIIKGCRTPIGKFLGGLSFLSASDLGALVIKSLLERPESIQRILMR